MNTDAHAFATALDRTVNRELRYRQALARAVWVEAQASFEQAQAANDARIDDAMTNDALLTRIAPGAVIRRALRNEPMGFDELRRAVRTHSIALAAIATLLAIAAVIG